MNKIIKEGNVAVLYSPGYGSPLFNCNRFDPDVAQLVLDGQQEQAIALMAERYPDTLADDLCVRWVPEGMRFYVHKYDGSERVILETEHEWETA